MITFNRFKGSKGLFEEYKKEGLLDLNDEAIVFIYDDKDRYIYDYSTNTYFGSTEIYVGSESPALDGSIKLWIDTNDSSIKYNPNNESWITISSGEGNLIYIGENPPADDSDYVIWINPDEVIEDDEEPLIIDTELNINSINPVQNSTITAEFNKLKEDKQDKLSDENLKTLDNESLLGKGNIDLESKYLKKTDAEGFITSNEVAEQYQPKGDYLTAEDLPEMPELATVATTGNYEDLSNKPTFKTINNQEITGEGNIEIEVASDIVVDSEISEESTNPVQNKVVKSYVDNAIANIPQSEGLELRELKMSGSADDNAYNLETLELMRENKVLPAMNAGDGTLVPITCSGHGQFFFQVVTMGLELHMLLTMAEDGSITMSQDFLAPYMLNSPSKVLEWLTKSKVLAQVGKHEPVYVIYNGLLCLVDCIEAGGTGSTRAVVQFNYGSQRFERVYNATTGEEISTTEIPLGGDSIEVIDNLESTETTSALSANQGKVLKELVDSKMDSTTFKTINGETILGEGNIDTNIDIPSCTVYASIDDEDPKASLTHEQALSNKDAFVKIKASVSNKTELDITVITVSYDGTETSYKNCFITDTGYSDSGLISATIESAIVVQNINKPYISHIKISQFTNGWEYYEEGWDIPAASADVNKKYLATYAYVDNHTTTYIGTTDPSTISSKYNLWVDTTNEEVVFKYKDADNAWQILSTGGNNDITVDTELDSTSENPIANKAVCELATKIGENFEDISKDLSNKANIEDGLVEGRGFSVSETEKYYLPGTTIPSDGVENTNILATVADIEDSELVNSKVTMYNLYAMNDLTEEQIASNLKAYQAADSGERAVYGLYTSDNKFVQVDVEIVPGPYLEACISTTNHDKDNNQVILTKYIYSFNNTGDYQTEEIKTSTLPNVDKVTEIVGNGGLYSKISITGESANLQPNTYYVFEGTTLTFTLAQPNNEEVVNEYVIRIKCTDTPTITLPNNLIWANGNIPEFTSGKTYLISIIDNFAIFTTFITE